MRTVVRGDIRLQYPRLVDKDGPVEEGDLDGRAHVVVQTAVDDAHHGGLSARIKMASK